MPEQPLTPKQKLAWAGAAVLCAVVLVFLWITAHQNRDRKLAARRGTPIEAPEPAGRIALRKGERRQFGHYSLSLNDKAELFVSGAEVRGLSARFPDLRKGDVRGLQELRAAVADVTPDSVTLDIELRPGAPCYGRGVYQAIREGLRIELPGDRAVTILKLESANVRVKVQAGAKEEELFLQAGSGGKQALSISLSVHRDHDGLWLVVD